MPALGTETQVLGYLRRGRYTPGFLKSRPRFADNRSRGTESRFCVAHRLSHWAHPPFMLRPTDAKVQLVFTGDLSFANETPSIYAFRAGFTWCPPMSTRLIVHYKRATFDAICTLLYGTRCNLAISFLDSLHFFLSLLLVISSLSYHLLVTVL